MVFTGSVTMYGYCRNVWEILGCADISVFPSRREGLGMAGLESLAMGVPVLASDDRGGAGIYAPRGKWLGLFLE